MKTKSFLLLVIIWFVSVAVALDYGDAQAYTMAMSRTDGATAWANCRCQCPSGSDWDYLQSSGVHEAEEYVDCNVEGDTPCRIYGHAYAKAPDLDQGESWLAFAADSMEISRQCSLGGGKGGKGRIRVYDSLHVVVDTIVMGSDTSITIEADGYCGLCNYNDESVGGGLTVYIWEAGEVGEKIYQGGIHFWGNPSTNWEDHVAFLGSWTLDDCTGDIDADDCLWVNIAVNDTISYAGRDLHELQVVLLAEKAHLRVPTSSEVSLVILILALISTGIGLIWWRKRRRAAAIA